MRGDIVFEVDDRNGKKIRLTKKQWRHITKYHRYMANYLEEIKETLIDPIRITDSLYDEKVRYHFTYLKHISHSKKYLLVAVRYLNGEGFVVTAYLEKNIK